MVDNSDKIIVLCDRRTWPDYLLKSKKVIYWKSRETKQMSYNERRKFSGRLKKKIQKLLKELE